MKTFTALMTAFVLSLATSIAFAESMSAEGRWRTIDDDTGEAKSIVRVWNDGGELKGQIIELLNPSEPNPKCTECKGMRKDKPIEGMTFLWGLEQDGDEWKDGKILDPANGKEYSAKVKVIDNGAKLEVRGYLGFALIGRTQVWERVE
ncbi:DUF2147 domain-containing protein [Saccharospirillum salsuginis]|uniref:DUF2147 domain-containing protein n=1 Tax=Saccharospirillum salsuginis TaxID=418750 RepID=A0A918K802_9GAMM|nr:DUF2147 domain-containing protein [Saccharospirillum salsuginis]GGX54017.1 hypothetical protein GCM10007392_21670 [Saccharospirillum salsuginis]